MVLFQNNLSGRGRPDRTLTDGLLWQWLELVTVSRTIYQDDLYKIIITAPTFRHDSVSFCKSLVAHSKTVMLPQGSERILEMWNYAENYLAECS